MVANVLLNKKGFTIVELLISILIMSVVFLALLHSMTIYMKYNMLTNLRNEAIKIAQDCAERLRVGQSCPDSVIRNFRKFSITFNITAPDPATFNSGANDVIVQVTYDYSGRSYSYNVRTTIYR